MTATTLPTTDTIDTITEREARRLLKRVEREDQRKARARITLSRDTLQEEYVIQKLREKTLGNLGQSVMHNTHSYEAYRASVQRYSNLVTFGHV